MKNLCARCDARPAKPGSIYCKRCLGEEPIHIRADWGMTRCGLDGWRSFWGTWQSPNAMKSTDNRRRATCRNCLRIKKKKMIRQRDEKVTR